MKKILKTAMLGAFLCSTLMVASPQQASADILIECAGSGSNCIISIGSPVDGSYTLISIREIAAIN